MEKILDQYKFTLTFSNINFNPIYFREVGDIIYRVEHDSRFRTTPWNVSTKKKSVIHWNAQQMMNPKELVEFLNKTFSIKSKINRIIGGL